MIQIRKYKKSDFNDLVKCMEKLQDYIVKIDLLDLNIRTNEYGNNYTNNLLQNIEKNNGVVYMMYDNENCIGCVAGIMGFTEDEYINEFKKVKIGHVIELFIDENYRGKKLGHKLMGKIEEYFKENSCNYTYVDVFAPNVGAHNFYQKLGYGERMITLSKKIK